MTKHRINDYVQFPPIGAPFFKVFWLAPGPFRTCSQRCEPWSAKTGGKPGQIGGSNGSKGTTKTGYGTTPVWCRGGSRYVEGCRGFLYLQIEKFCRIYQMFISWFLIDMKFISMISEILFNQCSAFPGAHLYTI